MSLCSATKNITSVDPAVVIINVSSKQNVAVIVFSGTLWVRLNIYIQQQKSSAVIMCYSQSSATSCSAESDVQLCSQWANTALYIYSVPVFQPLLRGTAEYFIDLNPIDSDVKRCSSLSLDLKVPRGRPDHSPLCEAAHANKVITIPANGLIPIHWAALRKAGATECGDEELSSRC